MRDGFLDIELRTVPTEDYWSMTHRKDHAGGIGPERGTPEYGHSPDAAEADAREALDAYPWLMSAGVVYTCLERVDRRWRILAAGLETPQQARDYLAHLFLVAAKDADTEPERTQFQTAADLLDWERHDKLTVAGRHFRIGRIERSVRVGPNGPEPPRPSDPEGTPGERVLSRRSLGFIDANALTGTAAAVLRHQLHRSIPAAATGEVREHARQALESHPRLVLLPVEFVAAEEVDGRWRPRFADTEVTPQAARDRLTAYLRPSRLHCDVPDRRLQQEYAELRAWVDSTRPAPEVCAEWEKAADLIDRDRLNDIHTAGYHFRIIRVDQIVRMGTDGPEPPRPSDPDPYDPPAVTAQQDGGDPAEDE